jgi:RNA polymerase sigma-70 factor (ECF subfamily)
MLEKPSLKTDPTNRSGQATLVADLFDRYHQGIFRYLYYRAGDQAIAEDLTSEVFLRAITALPGYRAQNGTYQAWLFQIARNLAIDHFRKMNVRQEKRLEEIMQTVRDDPDRAIEKGLTSETLRQALGQLPEVQREVIVLRFVAAMPVTEVAQALHKSEDAVKGLQRRALIALRDLLNDWEVVYV